VRKTEDKPGSIPTQLKENQGIDDHSHGFIAILGVAWQLNRFQQ
jgi:hypothetical protein